MNLKEYKTIAGIPADQIRSRLAEPFSDPSAYKKVNGTGADLTDIKTGHMLKRINEIFGIKGLGWNLLYNRDDLISPDDADGRILVRLKFAEFVYFLVHNESGEQVEIRIPTSGANENTPQYAEEGAKTVALGTALKGMGFQEDVYLGYLNHRNAATYRRPGKRNSNGNGKAAFKPNASKFDNLTASKSVDSTRVKANPGNFIITFGKNKGEALSNVSPKAVEWYANTMEPRGDKATALQQAAIAYLAAKAGKNGNGNGNDIGADIGVGNFVVSFGKNKGQKLSELPPETVAWYAEEMEPINEQGKALQTAALAFAES